MKNPFLSGFYEIKLSLIGYFNEYKIKSAHEKIRTSTNLRSQPPQGCASTNFATCANYFKVKKLSLSLTFCDRAGARTQDPLLKREMLYQLSYQVLS
jgi:hypothetical protein